MKEVVEQPKLNITTTEQKGGGFTCCVPLCYNNYKVNKGLSFYVNPRELCLEKSVCIRYERKTVIQVLVIVFAQSIFSVGKRHENNVPTILPKTIKPIVFKERKSRNSFGLIEKNNQFNVDESIDMTVENESELSVMKNEIECLKKKLHEKDVEMQEQKLGEDGEIAGFRKQLTLAKFCLDRFKHSEAYFKFYTGFDTFEMFNIFYIFLQPGANALIYRGSVANIDFTTEPSKYGRSRSLQPQEELFLTLVRLRCGLPIEDLSVRFNISTSTISRIITTWIDFLHSKLRA